MSFLVPLIVSFVAGAVTDRLLPPFGTSIPTIVLRWLVVVAVSTIFLILADRQMRKILPLAALLSMTMAFPDRAPSRFKVARRSAGVRNLDERVRRARREGISGSPVEAAEEILVLVSALTDHDSRTRGHSERTHLFTSMLARELHLPDDDRDRLTWAALVHDIGKIEVSPETLNKPGKPTAEEWVELRSHPAHGARICEPLTDWLGEWYHAIGDHHERWDGAGYPHGKAGTDISYAGRIVAVADAYEVITATRPYKTASSAEEARQELVASSGSHFDPAVVRAFLNISLGDLRSVAGPFSWLLQLPFLDGLGQTIGRLPTFVQMAAGSVAVVGTAAVTGVAPGLIMAAGAETVVAQAADVEVITPAPAESAIAPQGPGPEPSASPAPAATTAAVPPPTIFEGRPDDAVPATARPEPAAPVQSPIPNVASDRPEPAAPVPAPNPVAPATAPTPAQPPPEVPDPDPEPEPTPAVTPPTPAPEPSATPEPTTEPSVTPEPRPEPDPPATPDPTPEPPATPEPTPDPTTPPEPPAPVPNEPVARRSTLRILEDGSGSVDLLSLSSDADGDIDAASISIIATPALGTTSPVIDGRTTYRPSRDAAGSDSFRYQVCDRTDLCDSATITVVIDAVNDAPVAADDQATSEAGDRLIIDVLANDTDVDDDVATLTTSIDSPPQIGTVEVQPTGAFLFTSPIAFDGVSVFTYKACDTGGLCSTATVTVTVNSDAVAPNAVDDAATVTTAQAAEISVLSNDSDENDNLDPTTLTVADALNGTTQVQSGTVVYTSDAGYVGSDQFSYTICDTTGLCDSAIVRLTVEAGQVVASPPVANDDDAGVLRSPPLYYSFDVLVNDTDAEGNIDPSTLRVLVDPRRGIAGVTASGRIWYLAEPGRYGRYRITYEICDTTGLCDTAELTFRLNPNGRNAAAQTPVDSEMERILDEILGEVITPSVVRTPDVEPADTALPQPPDEPATAPGPAEPTADAIEPDTSADTRGEPRGPR